jgi:hypothetical protein
LIALDAADFEPEAIRAKIDGGQGGEIHHTPEASAIETPVCTGRRGDGKKDKLYLLPAFPPPCSKVIQPAA